MKLKIFLYLILGLLLMPSCVTDDVEENQGVDVGDRLPTFQVTLSTGDVLSDKSLIGKVAMIVLFSTSCPDCRRELPVVEKVYRQFENDEDVVIFAVSREERPGEVAQFWKEYGLTMPYSEQPDRYVYNLFASVGVPRIYISDKEGIIMAAYDDSIIFNAESISETIEEYR